MPTTSIYFDCPLPLRRFAASRAHVSIAYQSSNRPRSHNSYTLSCPIQFDWTTSLFVTYVSRVRFINISIYLPLLRTILGSQAGVTRHTYSRRNERNGCDDRDDCDARAAKNARGRLTPGVRESAEPISLKHDTSVDDKDNLRCKVVLVCSRSLEVA